MTGGMARPSGDAYAEPMSETTILHDDGVLEISVSRDSAGNPLDHESIIVGTEALHEVMRGRTPAHAILLTLSLIHI